MTDIEKRARELLLSQYLAAGFRSGDPMSASGANVVAIKAIAAALTPPEGYVMVPVEPTDAQLDRATWEEVGGHCSSCTAWAASHSDARRVWAAMLAARPAVGP